MAEEMAGAAALNEIQLLCGSSQYNHGVYGDARVLLCHTPLSELTTTYDDNYGGAAPHEVFYVSSLSINWTDNQWESLVFDTPFQYDGSHNLIIEFRWDGDDGNSVYDWGWYPAGGNRVLDASSSSAPTGTLRTYLNLLRIHFAGAMTLSASLSGDEIVLQWTPYGGAAAYWVYGTPDNPFFLPGLTAPFEYRLDVVSAPTTTWATTSGVADPAANWTFMVVAVDATDQELSRSNRAGEHDFGLSTLP